MSNREHVARTMVVAAVAVVTLLSGVTLGQSYVTGFEPTTYSGSAAGVVLTGQDSWTTPAGSNAYSVRTYAGGGWPVNPLGGSQFITGTSSFSSAVPAQGPFARAQRDVGFANTTYIVHYDFAARYSQETGNVDNVASVSEQPSTTSRFNQSLITWDQAGNVASTMAFSVSCFPASDNGNSANAPLFGTAFDGLLQNNWYRVVTHIDFATNQLVQIGLIDLTSGQGIGSFAVTDCYLRGGSTGSGLPLPTSLRFFAGGSQNELAFDNLTVAPLPEPGTITLMALGAVLGLRRRRR